jgi:hypothetical protein
VTGVGLVDAEAASATPAAVSVVKPVKESFERPDGVSARLAAAVLKHEILVTGDTTETSQTFVEADGSARTVMATAISSPPSRTAPQPPPTPATA